MAKEQAGYSFTDWTVQVVAIDYSGQFVALPGRGGLALVDLTKGATCIRKITRQSKWECNAVEWNPHDSLRHCLASTSNTKVELWKWREGSGSKEQDLRAHTRAISDLNWSRFEPNLLATCSYDSYIYIWDLRDCRKPKALSTVSGASQVKWNLGYSHILATSHDGDVRIWDLRKGNTPVTYISAHLSKISGLDWSPINGQELLTCSHDHAVKLWDIYDDPRNAKAVCDLRAPVWRAKYTPLGNAILTVPLSTASQRTMNVPYFWNIGNLKNPLQTFNRATSVLEFQWRRSQGDTEFQLLTWSKHQILKLWNLDPKCWQLSMPQDTCIREEHKSSKLSSFDPISSPEAVEFSLSGADVITDSDVASERDGVMHTGVGQPHNLEEEFAYVDSVFTNLVMEKKDVTNRSCVVSVNSGNNNCKMMITFPSLYPDNAMPSFEFTEDSPLDSATKVKIIKVLRDKAESFVKNNELCLEPCLNSLVAGLEDLETQESNTSILQHQQFIPMYSVGLDNTFGLQDAAIPFPRTSGATFCASGFLVCFSRSTRSMPRKREITPRSLSALSAYTSRSLSSFYNSETLKPGVTKSGGSSRKALVILRDSSPLMASHRLLAQNYSIFGDDAKELCEKNKKAAMMVGRQDLVHTWSLLALIMDSKLTPSTSSSESPWASHPFGRKLLSSLVDYYTKISDIQMLAMISIFLTYQKLPDFFGNPNLSDTTQDERDSHHKTVGMVNDESPKIEEDWTGSCSPSFTIINFKNPAEKERKRHEGNCSFIEKDKEELYDHFKLCYAELLYKWQLLDKRSEVLKFVVKPQKFHTDEEFVMICSFCQQYFSGPQCASCKKFAFHCSICRLPVKGLSNFCLSCGHGGHTLHILKWFETYDVCATGCGCKCPIDGSLIEPP